MVKNLISLYLRLAKKETNDTHIALGTTVWTRKSHAPTIGQTVRHMLAGMQQGMILKKIGITSRSYLDLTIEVAMGV